MNGRSSRSCNKFWRCDLVVYYFYAVAGFSRSGTFELKGELLLSIKHLEGGRPVRLHQNVFRAAHTMRLDEPYSQLLDDLLALLSIHCVFDVTRDIGLVPVCAALSAIVAQLLYNLI